ncbi:MAG: hypothetical protein H0V89_01605 [Deltaproteobacteria bacterium]|nr:hypothetical protein [Deltaproteobacteria bacterium]
MARLAPHLQLSLSRELWNELLRAALPVSITKGRFDLLRSARTALIGTGMRERVVGLLEDRAPRPVLQVRERARAVWKTQRAGLYRRMDEIVRVEGEYKVELDALGTELRYGPQRVGADAYVRATATGTIFFLRKNVEIPFVFEKRVGASINLADIRYDAGHKAVIGSLRDLEVFLGDGVLLQILSRLAEKGLEGKVAEANAIPILKREQVEEMVGPMGGPLKLKMGVDELELELNEQDMTLKVRFGFSQNLIAENPSD